MNFKQTMSTGEFKRRLNLTSNLPFHQFVGLKVLSHEPGKAEISVTNIENTINVANVVHGGILYSLLDVAAYVSLIAMLADHENAVTHDIHVSVLNPAPGDRPLTFKGNTLKMGKRLAFCQARAFSGDTLVASATVTKSIVTLKPLKG